MPSLLPSLLPSLQVKGFEAHTDYIRSIAVHPTLPYILTSSDDMLIKLWDWDKGWICTQIFEGHSHYVMQARAPPAASFLGPALRGPSAAQRPPRGPGRSFPHWGPDRVTPWTGPARQAVAAARAPGGPAAGGGAAQQPPQP